MLKNLFATLVLFTGLTVAYAEHRVATVDYQKAVSSYLGFAELQQELKEYAEQLENDLKAKAKSIQDEELKVVEELKTKQESRQDPSMSKAEKDKIAIEINQARTQFAQKKQGLLKIKRESELKVGQKNREINAKLTGLLKIALNDILKAEKYDVVINTNSNAVMFTSPNLDITNKIIEKMNENYAKKPTLAPVPETAEPGK